MDVDPYLVLGVGPEAHAEEVRAAYRRAARLHHPDRARGEAAAMAQVNAAWHVLGDPARRAAYDASVSAGEDARGHAGFEPGPLDGRDGFVPPRALHLLVVVASAGALIVFLAILLIGFGRVGTGAPP